MEPSTLDPRQKDRLKTESFHSYTTFYSRPSRGEGIWKLRFQSLGKLLKRLSQLSISELMALRFLCICYKVFSSKPESLIMSRQDLLARGYSCFSLLLAAWDVPCTSVGKFQISYLFSFFLFSLLFFYILNVTDFGHEGF